MLLLILVKREIKRSAARQRPLIIVLSIIFIIVQGGCGARPRPYQFQPPLSEEERAKLGTIGVVSARFVPEVEFHRSSTKGVGAAKGVAGGAPAGAMMGAAAGAGTGPFAPVMIPTLAALGAVVFGVVGGVLGAVEGVPSEKLNEADVELRNAVVEAKLHETMQDRILQVAREKTRNNFIKTEKLGPTASNEKVSYHSLAVKGVDTVLEVSVMKFGLVGKGGINPPLSMVMNVRIRLILTVNDAVIYEDTIKYKSLLREFTYWAENNAQPFFNEVENSYKTISEKIVERLL